MTRIELLGCPIDSVSMAEAVDRAEAAVTERHVCQHVAINAAKVVRHQHDQALRDAVAGCELITADGQAVVWAARFLGKPLRERVTGIDLMHELLRVAERRGYRIFLLGARPEVLEKAETEVRRRYPSVLVAGSHHGYWPRDGEPAVVQAVASAEPDMLFVALETPAKELFLARHRMTLAVPFIMGVGGAFDVLAGVRRRAPLAFRKVGLEWLYRLAQDPRRLARRYIVGNSQFIWLVVRERLRRS